MQLLPREAAAALHRPVDQFFRALAEDQRHQAIGVVLSGTASDGTLGLEAIKAEGGITFAQDDTAQHEGMPHSAIASGCVDFVLPPERDRPRDRPHRPTPLRGARVRRPRARRASRTSPRSLQLLHRATGVDFSQYKFNTLYRRITRRMVLQKLDDLHDYARVPAAQTPAEVEALYQDILISVTSFFRDPEAFEALKEKVFPRLLKDRARHDPVRIWTLGCSTGQEAYSLAMAFAEFAEGRGQPRAAPDLRHRPERGRHRDGPRRRLPEGHRAGRLAGAAAALLRRGGRPLPDQPSRSATPASSRGTTCWPTRRSRAST